MKFHLIENNGSEGLAWTECATIIELMKAIRNSNALDIYLIKGRELKIKKSYIKRTKYWDERKPVEIPELNLKINPKNT